MNIDTMTLDQIRDYIAECKGWRIQHGKHQSLWVLGDFPNGAKSKASPVHPVPVTYESVRLSLPESWTWPNTIVHEGGTDVAARRHDGLVCVGGSVDMEKRGFPAVLEAMLRAAAKAWQHERMAAKTLIIDPDKVTKESIEALMKDNGLIEEFRAVAAWPVQSKVTSAAPSYPVSQTWTLPTDTYPDGEVYGTWGMFIQMIVEDAGALCRNQHVFASGAAGGDIDAARYAARYVDPAGGGGGSVTDARPDPKRATEWRGPVGGNVDDMLQRVREVTHFSHPVPDARPSWRPTDVPKAEEVKEPVWRISKADRSAVLHYLRMAQVLGYADDRLFGVHTRLLFGDPEAP